MRTEKILIYEYEDMVALEKMSPKEASDVLEEAYSGYINSYIFPKEYEEYSVGIKIGTIILSKLSL